MRICSMLLGTVGALVICATAAAQGPDSTGPYNFSIPTEPLGDALNELAQQSGLQVLFSSQLVARLRGSEVKGLLTAEEALRRLLASTGLRFEFVNPHTIAITTAASPLQKPVEADTGTHSSAGAPASVDVPKASVNNNPDPSGEKPMRHRSLFARLFGLFAVCGSAIHTGTACAAEATSTTSGANTTARLDEIVVTAQRREERLQDVPIAVSAISGEQLAAAGVDSTTEIQYSVPGFISEPSGGYPNYFIRGIGNTNVGPGVESAVATYIDGVYVGATPGALMSLSNVERIEVLKGPQGTLFGRNTTGGLVQVITKDPQHKAQADVRVGYANYRTFSTDLYATTGLTDTLAADLSFSYSNQKEGYGTNLIDGEDYQRIPRELAARTKWLWEPGNTTRVKLAFDYSDVQWKYGYVPFPGPQPFGIPQSHSYYDVDINGRQHQYTKAYGSSLDIEHDFTQARLVSITSARKSDYDLIADLDGTEIPGPSPHYTQKEDQITQELQLQSLNSDKLSWVIGAYYFYGTGRHQPFQVFAGPANDVVFQYDSKGTTKSWAGFGQATYEFVPDTHITAGLRYTDEIRDARNTGVIPPISSSGHASFNKLTYRLSLDRKFTPNVLGYVSYNRGFQSGGFDLGSVQDGAYQPETLDAYEIGLKSEWLDNRIRFNAAAFYYEFDNLQLKVLAASGAPKTINGPKAKLDGIDLDSAFVINEQLQVSLGASYVHSEYKSFPNALHYNYNPNPAGTVVACSGSATPVAFLASVACDATGNQLPGSPKFSGNLAATYTIPVASGKIAVDGSFYYNGGWYPESDNQLKQPSYAVVNGAVTWSSGNENNSVKLWGKNLTDKHYATTISTLETLSYTYQPASPLTYGVTLQHRFR